MYNVSSRWLPAIAGGLLLGASSALALSEVELQQKADAGGVSLNSLKAELGLPATVDDQALYAYYKSIGQPAPEWLKDRLFPNRGVTQQNQRDGGDTPEDAVEITFAAGGSFTDTGTTVGFSDTVPVGQATPTECNSSFYTTSSFDGPDAWYTFTLEASYEVAASVCNTADYDSCIGIFDENMVLIAANDDGADCANWSSDLPPCCLQAGTYYLVIDAYGGDSGNYDLTVTFSDDECLTPCEEYAPEATVTAPALLIGNNADGVSVVGGDGADHGYIVTIEEDGFYDFDACFSGTSYALDLYLFDGDPCDGGMLVASQGWSDCSIMPGAARMRELNLAAGSYHLLIGDEGTQVGDYEVSIDPTPGRPTAGGPDEMGYAWMNSLDPEGPGVEWIDISATGEIAGLSDDSSFGPVDIGFTFPFYENTWDELYIGSNGFISFGVGSGSLGNTIMPSTSTPNDMIAMFWDDMNPSSGGSVYYGLDESSGAFIVQFEQVPAFGGSVPFSFEAQLYESGQIIIVHQDLDEGDLLGASVGIENMDGTIGLEYNYNGEGGILADGTAILFGQLDGDFLAPIVSFTNLPETVEAELPGDHMVEATITDDTGVGSASLFYRVNNGEEFEVVMTNTDGDTYEAGIPHQEMGSLIVWRIEAVDTSERQNLRVTANYSFEVVSYTWPPFGLVASDGLLDYCLITWFAPVEPLLAARWFGTEMPNSFDEAMLRLTREHGLDREEAKAIWLELLAEGGERSFLNYNVYRDDVLIGTTSDPIYYDLPGGGADPNVEYSYHVTAQFDAGESDLSNSDTGSRGARPTSGGPDEMGYAWTNSHDPEGPTFDWVEISDVGTNLGLFSLDDMVTIDLPWQFPFYDWTYTTITVSSNGYMTFGINGLAWTNGSIPDGFEPNDSIYPMWDDYNLGAGGGVYSYHDTDNDRFIVQWDAVPLYQNNGWHQTFQAILHPTGDMDFQYLDLEEGALAFATVGIENSDGTIGLLVNYNGDGGALVDELAIRVEALEGDFQPPMIVLNDLPVDMETELEGDYTISAEITDLTGIDSVSLFYQINGGASQEVAMDNAGGDTYEGDIPHQDAGSMISWWVEATDNSENANTRVSPTYSFNIVSYTWPPVGLVATDGFLSYTGLSWMPPVNPGLLARWFGGVSPSCDTEAIYLLQQRGLSKDEAVNRVNEIFHLNERVFIEYNVYRDGELIATTTGLNFTDDSSYDSEADVIYDYHVTASFDAGESDPSNTDSGYWGSPPSFGGPDAYGYTWVNSDHPTGPDFEWVDISGSGSAASLSDDSFDGPFDIGFDFPWYGGIESEVYIASNGYISFGQGYTGYWSTNPIPFYNGDGWSPDNMIAPFWDDLNPNNGGTVYYEYDEDEQRFIVQFDGIMAYSSGGPFTFEIILYPSGIIEVAYDEMDQSDVANANVGIENADASGGLGYRYQGEGGSVADETMVVYLPQSSCEPVDCTGIVEVEPNQGWEDGSYNSIRCADVICGELESDGTTTDSDWYLYTHFGGNIEVIVDVSDFDARLTLRESAPGGDILADANTFPRCFGEAFSLSELESGSYYIVVEHDGDPDLEGPQSYALMLNCSGDPCAGHEPIDCSGTAEAEPNEGWNADPPNSNYGVIALDETICGTVWADAGERDMDWFLLELESATELVVSCEIDGFDAALFITDMNPEGGVLYEVDDAPACHPESISVESLPAGSYFIVIGHNEMNGVPEEQAYALTVSGSLPTQDMCDGYEDVPDFHDIWTVVADTAPEYAHHSGTGCPGDVSSPGLDYTLRVVLAEPMDLHVAMTGEGNADEVILLVGNCATPAISCGAAANDHGPGTEGEVLEFMGLPAGDYWLVADFAGYGESHPFVMQVIDMNSGLLEGRELSFELRQNYPNPFNPVTTVQWIQPEMAKAEISIYNLKGERVMQEDLGLRGPGSHTFTWNAASLPSGVYVYTLSSGEWQATRKAVLLK